MKRSGPPARKTPIKRGGRPKARNPKRRASEFERCYHSHERVEWVSAQRCAVCLSEVFNGCDNAHIAGDGMGRKGSYDKIIPLCKACHRLQHKIGAGTFAIRFNLNLRALAAATERAWLAHSHRESA